MLTHGEGFSFEETARFLCISRSSVQTLAIRAKKNCKSCSFKPIPCRIGFFDHKRIVYFLFFE
ncbi:hypothetical protein O0550_23540 [Brevibacillus halotolerans]|uniref:hypothetical protein n=1 Tax=Brevibacillus TaxID=55080 RepID=UPI00215BED4E|nr:hypothetical protein [Brevibacillus laterosporus]MCR8966121.1 hypothetical protein [Brevibacillus laterosporus]MCZ0838278.1 hypothetical protein [Brevibacillus halotolerans]